MTTPSITNMYQNFKINIEGSSDLSKEKGTVSDLYLKFESSIADEDFSNFLKQSANNKLLGDASESAENQQSSKLPKDSDLATPLIREKSEEALASIDNLSSDPDRQAQIDAEVKKRKEQEKLANMLTKYASKYEGFLPNIDLFIGRKSIDSKEDNTTDASEAEAAPAATPQAPSGNGKKASETDKKVQEQQDKAKQEQVIFGTRTEDLLRGFDF